MEGTHLPAASGSLDAVFALFALHEVREHAARAGLFAEIRRVLSPDGVAVLAEHHRDLANWLAYGPGAMHFHRRRTWLRAIAAGGMEVAAEFPLTPLVRVMLLRSSAAPAPADRADQAS